MKAMFKIHSNRSLPLVYFAAALVGFGLLSTQSLAEIKEVRIKIEGLSCPFCVKGLEMKLKEVPSLKEFKTSYKYGYLQATLKKESGLAIQEIRSAIQKSGFTFQGIELTLIGKIVQWEENLAVQVSPPEQLFLLYEGEKNHSQEELLSTKRQKELESLRDSGKRVQITGAALEVIFYNFRQGPNTSLGT
jgi:mercuric ion binding protein